MTRCAGAALAPSHLALAPVDLAPPLWQSETEVTIKLQEVEELAGHWQRPTHWIEAKVTNSSCELEGRRGDVRSPRMRRAYLVPSKLTRVLRAFLAGGRIPRLRGHATEADASCGAEAKGGRDAPRRNDG